MNIDTTTPIIRTSLRGMNMNHMKDEISRAKSQTKDENINKIIFIGSSVIVQKNIASAGPNATNEQPINSAAVIFYRFNL